MSNVTQKFLGYFPEVSANKCTNISLQEFLCILRRCTSLPLPEKKLPQGRSDILMAGTSTSRSQGLELSWTAGLSEPAADDATTASETHGKKCFLLFKIHKETFPMEGIGLSAKDMSDLWWGKKECFFCPFEKNRWFSIITAKVQTERKKRKTTLYVNDHNNH